MTLGTRIRTPTAPRVISTASVRPRLIQFAQNYILQESPPYGKANTLKVCLATMATYCLPFFA